ncbi:hypothetical protein ebA6143 [Aromatoleum aromaticum EbN1]|uniref:Uncharacterized protein n=1 Tax=Aromatoleum aromaticum (strain DSM 19018 / LMG 30748 / EbN1) TaxID=76114 RepID=Q5NZ79_AROAE|nr:hypothetical protein ebA6143 [Aromatoleum aromaticum EbN1]
MPRKGFGRNGVIRPCPVSCKREDGARPARHSGARERWSAGLRRSPGEERARRVEVKRGEVVGTAFQCERCGRHRGKRRHVAVRRAESTAFGGKHVGVTLVARIIDRDHLHAGDGAHLNQALLAVGARQRVAQRRRKRAQQDREQRDPGSATASRTLEIHRRKPERPGLSRTVRRF